MKTQLVLYFILVVTIASCKKNTPEPDPAKNMANFKVELTQSGKYEGYLRLITLEAGMVYEGTNRNAIVLTDGDLTKSTYSFITSEKLKIFQPSFKIAWYGDELEEGILEVKIYRNEKLIDSQTITMQPSNAGKTINYSWTYQAQ